jgi:lincosamide nucleotidyltransferase A/C/D/E
MQKEETKTIMEAKDVVDLVRLLESENVDVWIDGGWSVDALLGKQLRLHKDLDIAAQWKDVPKLREMLSVQGYKQVREDNQ